MNPRRTRAGSNSRVAIGAIVLLATARGGGSISHVFIDCDGPTATEWTSLTGEVIAVGERGAYPFWDYVDITVVDPVGTVFDIEANGSIDELDVGDSYDFRVSPCDEVFVGDEDLPCTEPHIFSQPR
jgi:hypothetical protein